MKHDMPKAAGRGAKRKSASSSGGMPGMQMEQDPAFAVTRPQLIAMSVLSVLALVAGTVFAVSQANLTVSAREVAGVVMPPGMAVRRDLSGASMRDMSAVDPRAVRSTAPADARGDQLLAPRLDGAVKVYDLEAAVTGLIDDRLLVPQPTLRHAIANGLLTKQYLVEHNTCTPNIHFSRNFRSEVRLKAFRG